MSQFVWPQSVSYLYHQGLMMWTMSASAHDVCRIVSFVHLSSIRVPIVYMNGFMAELIGSTNVTTHANVVRGDRHYPSLHKSTDKADWKPTAEVCQHNCGDFNSHTNLFCHFLSFLRLLLMFGMLF